LKNRRNIKEEVKTFLKNVDTEEAKKHSEFLENNRNMVAMARAGPRAWQGGACQGAVY